MPAAVALPVTPEPSSSGAPRSAKRPVADEWHAIKCEADGEDLEEAGRCPTCYRKNAFTLTVWARDGGGLII